MDSRGLLAINSSTATPEYIVAYAGQFLPTKNIIVLYGHHIITAESQSTSPTWHITFSTVSQQHYNPIFPHRTLYQSEYARLGCSNKDNPQIPHVSKEEKSCLVQCSGPPQISKGSGEGDLLISDIQGLRWTEEALLSTGLPARSKGTLVALLQGLHLVSHSNEVIQLRCEECHLCSQLIGQSQSHDPIQQQMVQEKNSYLCPGC